MAIMTKKQEQGKNDDRSYVRPLYPISPNAKSVEEGKHTAGMLVFEGNEYKTIDVVACDRRFVYSTGSFMAQDLEEHVVYSDEYVTKTKEYLALVAKHGEKEVKYSYENLVYIPSLSAFAILATKKYAKSINEAFEKVEPGTVITIEANYDKPQWWKFNSLPTLFNVTVEDKLIDIDKVSDYKAELSRFTDIKA